MAPASFLRPRPFWGAGLCLSLTACSCSTVSSSSDGGPKGATDSSLAATVGAASAGATGGGSGAQTQVRVYVAGESIERRNRYVHAPFTATGALDDRGGGEDRNDREEYGWTIPFADRIHLRDPSIEVVFVGADTWLDADDNPYDGTYPAATPGATSAISGTDIESWVEQRKAELVAKTHCYDVAFAARGGNDFGSDDDADYKAKLSALVKLLAAGSSCRKDPIVYVTAHLPDDQRDSATNPTASVYIGQQKHRFVERTQAVVTEFNAAEPALRVRFVDMYTPFLVNKATTAFPNEVWSKGGSLDFVKITRPGDTYHPRRLASIYAGENAADAVDLAELRTVKH